VREKQREGGRDREGETGRERDGEREGEGERWRERGGGRLVICACMIIGPCHMV